MNQLKRLRAELQVKRNEAREMLDKLQVEKRTFDPKEKEAYEKIKASVYLLTEQIESLQTAGEDDQGEPQDNTPPPTGRRSRPIGADGGEFADDRRYSLLRALRCVSEGRPLDGYEAEVSQEIARRSGQQPKGFYLPLQALNVRPSGRNGERRDLTTTTGAGLVGSPMTGEVPMIEMLRDATVLKQLGARFLTDLKGIVPIARQTGGSVLYWVGEGVSADTSNMAVDEVELTPKVAIAGTTISKQLLVQSSYDAEQLVREDLVLSMAVGLDKAGLVGTGGAQPTGVTKDADVISLSAGLQIGTNGGPLTFAKLVAMESEVAASNVRGKKLAYLVSPRLRGALKVKEIGSAGYPVFAYTGTNDPEVGQLNGYPAYATNLLPSNVTKGSGSNLANIVFGDWSDLLIGQWGAVDIVTNPYTLQMSGAVIISASMAVDVRVRRPQSFRVIFDAATS